MKRPSAFCLAFALALGIVIQGALPAHACSCIMPDPYSGLAEGDGAFVGTLVEVDRDLSGITSSDQLADYIFDVEVTLKGEIGDAILVKSAADGAACGIEAPIGTTVGIVVERVGSEWHGSLCQTYEAASLIAAAEGPPEPVSGSPPHLIVVTPMGEAALVALDRQGRIVGYGPGSVPWLLTACPDDETLIGVGADAVIRVWSFRNLQIVGEYELGADHAFRNLTCAGPAGQTFYTVTESYDDVGTTASVMTRFVDGAAERVTEDIEQVVETSTGLVAIGSAGTIYHVDVDTGELEVLIDSVGDVRGQVAYLSPSPTGAHIAMSTYDWNSSTPSGRIVVIDVVDRTGAELATDCDVYPIWIGNDQLSLLDSCSSDQHMVYDTDLNLIGPGDYPGPAYGATAVDETGAVFFPDQTGISVLEPGAEAPAVLVDLPGYAQQILVVPEPARETWTGSDFVPSPPTEAPPVAFVDAEQVIDPILDDVVTQITMEEDAPGWLIVVGSLSVAGVLWILLRRPGGAAPEDQPVQ